MRRLTTPLTIAALAVGSLALGACGDSSDGPADAPAAADAPDGGSTPDGGSASGDDVTDALEAQTPSETVAVPPADGATTIADYAAGGSSYEPADPAELAQILAIVGTDADGYLTDDVVVVRTSAADATLLCKTADRLGVSTYSVIPVLPDGTGVDCG